MSTASSTALLVLQVGTAVVIAMLPTAPHTALCLSGDAIGGRGVRGEDLVSKGKHTDRL